jgi:hypothetical protein
VVCCGIEELFLHAADTFTFALLRSFASEKRAVKSNCISDMIII